MKKTFLFLSFVAIALASCDPLSQTYKDLDSAPKKKVAITVGTAYATQAAAIATTGVPTALSTAYGNTYSDGSTALVTYVLQPTSASPTSLPIPDTKPADLTYTMTTPDYTFPGNTFTDLTSAGVLSYLAYKYPNPVPFQVSILTYNYYESGYAGTSGTITTDVFIYGINKQQLSAWIKTYAVSAAQYASLGRGLTNTFGTADLPNLSTYFNTLLKADLSVSLTAVAGDIKYVSYKYNNGTMQEVLPMIFDGTNWACKFTNLFTRANGAWSYTAPIPATPYTLVTADFTLIANSSFGTATQRTSLGKYGDFSAWTAADLQSAFNLVLTTDFPTAKAGAAYAVTYLNYTGGVDVPTVAVLIFDGTSWTVQ